MGLVSSEPTGQGTRSDLNDWWRSNQDPDQDIPDLGASVYDAAWTLFYAADAALEAGPLNNISIVPCVYDCLIYIHF
jgi:hypothetical protein